MERIAATMTLNSWKHTWIIVVLATECFNACIIIIIIISSVELRIIDSSPISLSPFHW